MNLGSDSEDEFFGCQSDNDNTTASNVINPDNSSAGVESAGVKNSDHQHQRLSSPPPVDSSHGALSLQESIAHGRIYKNIGYHQAYDRHKEVKLQEGFEAGYRTYIDDAMRLGDLLGKHMMAMANQKSNPSDVFKVIANIKNYLIQSQSVSSNTNGQEDKELLYDVLDTVQKQLDA
jgi:hypothetical protein